MLWPFMRKATMEWEVSCVHTAYQSQHVWTKRTNPPPHHHAHHTNMHNEHTRLLASHRRLGLSQPCISSEAGVLT